MTKHELIEIQNKLAFAATANWLHERSNTLEESRRSLIRSKLQMAASLVAQVQALLMEAERI